MGLNVTNQLTGYCGSGQEAPGPALAQWARLRAQNRAKRSYSDVIVALVGQNTQQAAIGPAKTRPAPRSSAGFAEEAWARGSAPVHQLVIDTREPPNGMVGGHRARPVKTKCSSEVSRLPAAHGSSSE